MRSTSKSQAAHIYWNLQVRFLLWFIIFSILCSHRDGDDNRCGGDYLIEAGLSRARCISSKVDFNNLKYIFAQNPGKCDEIGKIKREYQTVYPVALKYNVTINTKYKRYDETIAAMYVTIDKKSNIRNQLCNTDSNQVGSALFSWDHEYLPILFQNLGCKNLLCRTSLPDDEYDMIFRLTMDCATGRYIRVEKLRQHCDQGI